MTNKDIKQLSPAVLKEQVLKLEEKQTFVVTIGEEDFEMTHDVFFRKTKMHKVLDDMVEFFNEGGKKIEILDLATPYTALLILKHFTSLEIPEDIDESLTFLEVLIDLEALDKILNALPEDEVSKVYKLLTQTIEAFKEGLDEADKEAEALSLENAEVLGIGVDGEQNSAIESD